MQDFSHSLPMMMNRTLDSVLPEFRAVFKTFDLTEQQWRILRVLWHEDGLKLSDISAQTLLPKPSLVGIIDRMEDKGLLKRIRSTSDRRSVRISTTAKGRRLEEKIQPLVDECYAQIVSDIKPGDWKIMMNTLQQIIDNTEGQARTKTAVEK